MSQQVQLHLQAKRAPGAPYQVRVRRGAPVPVRGVFQEVQAQEQSQSALHLLAQGQNVTRDGMLKQCTYCPVFVVPKY